MKFLSAIALMLILFSNSAAAEVAFSQLYLDGDIVGTVVPPAAAPMTGTDPVYPIMGGVGGQLPVAGTGPSANRLVSRPNATTLTRSASRSDATSRRAAACARATAASGSARSATPKCASRTLAMPAPSRTTLQQ